MPKIIIPGFKGGYSNDLFSSLDSQKFQSAKDLEVFTNDRTISPHLALGIDTTDKTINNVQPVSGIKASDGKYYFTGFDSTAGTTATLWQASTLGTSTPLISKDTSSTSRFGKPVEFLSNLFYTDGVSMRKFNLTSGSDLGITVSNQADIFVHEGLGKMYYTVSAYQIGSSDDITPTSTAVLTFNNNQLITNMCPFGQYVAVGLHTSNENQTSKIAIWDGSAFTIEDLIDIGDTGLQGIANVNGTIYALCSSNVNGTGKFNVIRLYRWRGGSVELVFELDLKATVANLVTINPRAISVSKDTLFFGMNATTANSMTIDNGVWAYNQKTGILTLDRVVSDTSDINISSIDNIDGSPMVTWYDGTNYHLNHVPASNAKSALGIYESEIFPLDGTVGSKRGIIESIEFNHIALPTSCGFTISVKHYGAYEPSGIPVADSYVALTTAQGTGGSTGKTQSTDNATYTLIKAPAKFKRATHAQIKIAFDETSNLNAASIVFPIIINSQVE